jgi:hypothetical protein
MGVALPLGTLALTAWKAYPSLAEAWRDDLYSHGIPLAFLIWLIPQAYLFIKGGRNPTLSHAPTVFILIALALYAAGVMSSLRILNHLALVFAIPGVFQHRWLTGLITLAAAPSWLPATGYFISRVKTGGLDGWERPLFALVMTAILLAIGRIFERPAQPIPTPT